MALSKKVVAFSLNTTTGNQAITGVGFQPKLVILLCNGTGSVAAGNGFWSLGAATSSTARWAIGQWHTDGAASSETSRVCRTDKILDVPNPAGSGTDYQADLVSMDADGFTINIGTTGGVALRCIALCLAGTDLDVAVGSFNTGTTTGVVTAVSGLSFQPKAVLTAHATTSASVSATTRQNIGFASGASNEWGAANFESDNSATMATQHGWVDTRYIYGGSGGAADTELAFNAFTSDGWSHDLVAVPASLLICYIAFGGSAQYYVGSDAQKATTGTEALTGAGFQPSALITNMSLRTTTGYDGNGDFFTHIGFMDGTSEAGGHVFSDDATANAETSRGIDETYSLFAVTDDATPTVAAKASLSSFDSDGFTVNWNTADATARLFGFLAIGAAAGGSLNVSATTDALTLAEYAATIGKSLNISATTDALTLAEYAATVGSAIDISATTDALTLAEYAATIGLSLNVQATTDALTLAEYPASLGNTQNVQATTDALTLAEYPATLTFALNVSATTDALVLAEYGATVSDGTAPVVPQNPSVGGGRPGRTYAYPSEPVKRRRKAPEKPQEPTSVPEETTKPYEVAGRLGAITEVPDNVVQLPVPTTTQVVTGSPIEPVQKSLEELVNEAVKKAMAEYQAVQDGEKILKQLEKEEAELSLSEVESLLLLAMVE